MGVSTINGPAGPSAVAGIVADAARRQTRPAHGGFAPPAPGATREASPQDVPSRRDDAMLARYRAARAMPASR